MNGISRKLPDTERARLKRILKEVLPGVVGRHRAHRRRGRDRGPAHARRAAPHRPSGSTSARRSSRSRPRRCCTPSPTCSSRSSATSSTRTSRRCSSRARTRTRRSTSYLASVAPDLLERVERYEGEHDPFDEFRVTEQIEKALDRKVWLPSGGSLVIDRTEAMTVVDVNTGKFVGSGGNLEETVTKNNLEAAEEIVRQLRLRDIGGIIVVDFIDMVLESNRDLVLRRLVECLSRDRTKHQVAEVTSLGLVQMTRKKLGLGLLETFSEPCEVCAGRGVIVHHDPVVKHRVPTGGGASNRRPRAAAPSTGGSNGTHVITEGVKSALAQIAASTIHHHDEVAPAAEAAVEEPVVEQPKKKPRKKRPDRAKPQTEKDLLLDSVLNALPQPKAPGQGRSRRRVTTAALTGTPIAHTPSDD